MSYITMPRGLSSARGLLRPLIEILRDNQKAIVPRNSLDDYVLCRHLSYIIKDRRINLIVDVGANRGQFAQRLRRYCSYTGDIVSFEPQPAVFECLNKLASKDRRWSAHNIALGKERSSLHLNVMRSSVFSSFLKPKGGLMEDLNGVVDMIEVPIDRLDRVLGDIDPSSSRVLLKTDTQGFDLEVIEGAMGVMRSVEAIVSEVSVIPIYERCPDYMTTIDTLNKLDFVLSGMYPVTLTMGKAVEFDCIMVKDHKDGGQKPLSYASMLKDRHL